MTVNVIMTPFDLSEAVKAGRRRFWKQVLPVTSIDYKGQKVDFDPGFHTDLSEAFENKAFDQVPVVFADANNAHNMDPRNFGGDVIKMEYRGPAKDQGTWALIEADRSAAKAIQKNPRLGVSARIRQMVQKADGRKFDRAIEHLCLTMNPRVTGMSPWQAVDLSEDADLEVVDLTAFDYTEGTAMATATSKRRTARKSAPTIDLSNLTDEQFKEMLDLAESFAEVDPDDVDDEDGDGEEEIEDTGTAPTERKTRRKKSKTKITVEKDSEDDGDDGDDEGDEDDESTDLSDADRVIKDTERSQFQQMRYDLAEEKWEAKRSAYLTEGVPAFLLDLADPVLSLPDSLTIDLSDDEQIDATSIITKMLDGVKGVVDLTGEIGTALDLNLSDEEKSSSDAFLADWEKTY